MKTHRSAKTNVYQRQLLVTRVREDGWTVQGWPVHQTDWKREILRAVVEEGAELPADEPGDEA